MKDLISIIVPIYNMEEYLDECIASICNQTYTNLEILLIDDGSKDKSGTMADAWRKKDERCKVFHQANGGISVARNLGISKASGEYLIFTDSDDILESNMVERLYSEAVKEKVDMVLCGIKRKNTEKEYAMNYLVPSRIYTLEEYIYEMYAQEHMTCGNDMFLPLVAAWNKIYKASLFQEIHYPNGHIHEDNAIIHRLVHAAKRVKWLNEPLYIYRERRGSIMQSSFSPKRIDDFYAQLDRVKFMEDKTQNQKLKDMMVSRCLNTGRWYWCKMQALKAGSKEEIQKIYVDIKNAYKKYVKKTTFSTTEKVVWFTFIKMHMFYMTFWNLVYKLKSAR